MKKGWFCSSLNLNIYPYPKLEWRQYNPEAIKTLELKFFVMKTWESSHMYAHKHLCLSVLLSLFLRNEKKMSNAECRGDYCMRCAVYDTNCLWYKASIALRHTQSFCGWLLSQHHIFCIFFDALAGYGVGWVLLSDELLRAYFIWFWCFTCFHFNFHFNLINKKN